jgi:hypothetical protein
MLNKSYLVFKIMVTLEQKKTGKENQMITFPALYPGRDLNPHVLTNTGF